MLAGVFITGDTGGTFLAWSIYYLSGATHYYNARHDEILPLIENPLTESNAHGFYPNFPSSVEEFNLHLVRMKNRSDLNVIFMHELDNVKQADINVGLQSLDRIVYVSFNRSFMRYFVKYETRSLGLRHDNPSIFYSTYEEQHKGFIEKFFAECLAEFGSIDKPWDHREFLAMNLDHSDLPCIDQYLDKCQFSHFLLDSLDVWVRLNEKIREIFQYLNLQIDEDRLGKWLQIYASWKLFHTKRLDFCNHFEEMINAILAGTDMDLVHFDLDVVQEAELLRTLMRDHGLNLKAYGLDRFRNTKELHALLEPNIHT